MRRGRLFAEIPPVLPTQKQFSTVKSKIIWIIGFLSFILQKRIVMKNLTDNQLAVLDKVLEAKKALKHADCYSPLRCFAEISLCPDTLTVCVWDDEKELIPRVSINDFMNKEEETLNLLVSAIDLYSKSLDLLREEMEGRLKHVKTGLLGEPRQ